MASPLIACSRKPSADRISCRVVPLGARYWSLYHERHVIIQRIPPSQCLLEVPGTCYPQSQRAIGRIRCAGACHSQSLRPAVCTLSWTVRPSFERTSRSRRSRCSLRWPPGAIWSGALIGSCSANYLPHAGAGGFLGSLEPSDLSPLGHGAPQRGKGRQQRPLALGRT